MPKIAELDFFDKRKSEKSRIEIESEFQLTGHPVYWVKYFM